MKHFMYRLPGSAYAGDLHAPNEEAAREKLRKSLNVRRLPRGTEIWEVGAKSRLQVEKSMQRDAAIYHKAGQLPDI